MLNFMVSDVSTRFRKISDPYVSIYARMIGENRQTIDNCLFGKKPCKY